MRRLRWRRMRRRARLMAQLENRKTMTEAERNLLIAVALILCKARPDLVKLINEVAAAQPPVSAPPNSGEKLPA